MTNPGDETPEQKLLKAIFGDSQPSGPPASEETMEELRAKVRKVLSALTFREREIIKIRYGLSDGYTYNLEETGRVFKITRDRVRQIEARAVRKLQHPVRARKLEGFLEDFSDTNNQ